MVNPTERPEPDPDTSRPASALTIKERLLFRMADRLTPSWPAQWPPRSALIAQLEREHETAGLRMLDELTRVGIDFGVVGGRVVGLEPVGDDGELWRVKPERERS